MRIPALRWVLTGLSLSIPPVAVAACGTSIEINPNGGGNDAGGTGPTGNNDAGSTSDVAVLDSAPAVDSAVGYPAPHPDLPQIPDHGGAVLTAPKIVTVTFDGDSLRPTFESFGDTIGTTPWWDAVRAGYCTGSSCVGQTVSTPNPHVHLATVPTGTGSGGALTDSQQGTSDIQSWLVQMFTSGNPDGGTGPAFKDADEQTLYLVYFPSGVNVSLDGTQSCVPGGFGGYHQSVKVTPPGSSTAINIPYAIIPRCPSESGEPIDQTATLTASHELIEAATDPYPNASLAYALESGPNILWTILGGGETGDMCVTDIGFLAYGITTTPNYWTTESGFLVQRTWSNASAKASHDPCVPIPQGEVYFNTAIPTASVQTQLAVGSSTTIDVQGFSDAPTGDWTLKFLDFAVFQGQQPVLTFSSDVPTLNNGKTAKVTIKLTGNPVIPTGNGQNVEPYVIVSVKGKESHYWPGVIIPQ
jgi:hypothetical protein